MENGFKVGMSYPEINGNIQLTVGTPTIQFVRLSIKISELQVAAQILIDTFEEQEIWK